MEWVLVGVVAVLSVLSIPVLWILMLTRRDAGAELRPRLDRLEARIARLQVRIDEMSVPATPAPVAEPTPPPPEPETVPAPALPEAEPALPEPQSTAAEKPPWSAGSVPPVVAPRPAAAVARRETTEEAIMRRWLVWVGAVALALGGVFLVKYSIEQGYFGPAARIVAGTILGLALIAISEVVRRQPLVAAPIGPVQPDYVPPALAASGVAVLFASIYAGYAVYDLIPPGLAFLLLAVIAFGGAALSLIHGPFLALLGFAGAYVVPLLVSTTAPSVPRLLAYVLVVSAGCLWLVRWRDWAWLGWTAVAGSFLWAATALVLSGTSDEVWFGLFALLLAACFLGVAIEPAASRHRAIVAWSGAAASTVLVLMLAAGADVDAASYGFVWALSLLYAAAAIWWPRFDRLPWMAALLQLLVLAGHPLSGATRTGPSERFALLFEFPPSSALKPYFLKAVLLAAAAGIGGFAMVWRAPAPQRWAALSAATPLAALAIVYWRSEQFAASLPWATVAILLAAAFMAATERAAVRRAQPGFTNALACYALGVTGAVALGLTLSLRLGWLSVALSLQLPAIAWLHQRTGVRALRLTALGLGLVVLVRLLLNPAVTGYELGGWPVFNGLLYTYGIPAAAFAVTAWWLRQSDDDGAVQLLEAGALALAVALVSLEIRHFMGGGRIDAGTYGLLEGALQADAWLAIAYGLMPRPGASERPVRAAAWRLIALVAAAHVVFVQCLAANPLVAAEPVGDLPILDGLLLAYAVPAVFAWAFQRGLARPGMEGWSRAAGVAALALAFVYISLEVRHLFQGSRLDGAGASDGEWYAYSAAWLVFAAALLALGIVKQRPPLRLAGLVVGALVAVKAFGFDMATLTGLYRAASFLGLGASLVALGWLYQRVAAPAAPRPS